MSTIRDVAKLAGVSIATVSRVLNHDEKFQTSSTTKQKVWGAAQALDYSSEKTKHPSAGSPPSVLSGKHLRVGCVLNRSPLKYIDSFYMSLLSNFENELNRLGGILLFTKTPMELELQRDEMASLYKNIGSIVMMEYLSSEMMAEISSQVPYVLGLDIESPDIDTITYDRVEATMIATEHLLQMGHRRIAYIGGNERQWNLSQSDYTGLWSNKRFWGYRYSLLYHQLPFDPDLVKNCHWDSEYCSRQIKELLALPQPPTAILCASDTLAITAISVCGELGYSVPLDISIIGINDNDGAKYSNPPLTTVRIPQDTLGVLAARILAFPQDGYPHKQLVPLTLVERKSVHDISSMAERLTMIGIRYSGFPTVTG